MKGGAADPEEKQPLNETIAGDGPEQKRTKKRGKKRKAAGAQVDPFSIV